MSTTQLTISSSKNISKTLWFCLWERSICPVFLMLVERFLRLVLMFLKCAFNLIIINYSTFESVLFPSPVSSPSFESAEAGLSEL